MSVNAINESIGSVKQRTSLQSRVTRYIKKNIFFFLLLAPGTILIILFYYVPYYGLLMGFQDFSIGKGILHSPFVGLKNFIEFFSSVYFIRILNRRSYTMAADAQYYNTFHYAADCYTIDSAYGQSA